MKSKIALILCIVMIISCLASCQKAPEITDGSMIDSSASQSEVLSQETSDDNSEDETPAIPENALYFTGSYYFPYYDGHVLSRQEGLNEWHSYGIYGSSITEIIENNSNVANSYYYLGVSFYDRNTTDKNELQAKNEKMLKQVGFVPTDEPYLKNDYVLEFISSSSEIAPEAYEEHAQNLMPDVDLSAYQFPEGYGFGYLTDFRFDYTGYITLEGLEQLVDNYTMVFITWLPAPDNRERFLTYIHGRKIGG